MKLLLHRLIPQSRFGKIGFFLILLFLVLSTIVYSRRCSSKCPVKVEEPRRHLVPSVPFDGNYCNAFCDLNDVQLEVAEKIGITPLDSIADVAGLTSSHSLKKIESNRNYYVDELTFSVPYLIPRSAELLNDLGQSFADTLAKRGYPPYRFIVTSVLRTREHVSKLKRGNPNATTASTHCYGTTFDISWIKFMAPNGCVEVEPRGLKELLGAVINNYHLAGHCYVKYERKQPCFHITARPI